MRHHSPLVLLILAILAIAIVGIAARPHSGLADTPSPSPTPPASASTTGGLVFVGPEASECPAAGLPRDQVAATVSFPPGWNLVSGPVGSCMRGATAAYAVTGLSSRSYVVFDPNTTLSVESGVWAYFPVGGSIDLTQGDVPSPFGEDRLPGNRELCGSTHLTQVARSFVVSSAGNPGDLWVLFGNRSPYGPEKIISGAEQVLAYSPDRGYYTVDEIPLGQAVWILTASGQSVSSERPAAPTPPPPTASMLLSTCRGLASLALRQDDLPGFMLLLDGASNGSSNGIRNGAEAGYSGLWFGGDLAQFQAALAETKNPSLTDVPVIADGLIAYSSPEEAHAAFLIPLTVISDDAEQQDEFTSLGAQGLGDEDLSGIVTVAGNGAGSDRLFVEAFRRGSVFGLVAASDRAGGIAKAVELARSIDGRLAAAQQ